MIRIQMPMKLLIIRSNEELVWNSCRSISKNLQEAYACLGDASIEWFDLNVAQFLNPQEDSVRSLALLAKRIKIFAPDRIIFLDHLPLPPTILLSLRSFLSLSSLPPIIVHIYGDFTYFAYEWSYFLDFASGVRFLFLAASESQCRLLRYFLSSKVDIKKCYFPVADDCTFSPELRNQFRQEVGVKDDDFVLIYAGRLNLQKNVDLLIKEFANHLRAHPDRNIYLLIAGGIDDSGANVFGIKTHEGYLYSKLSSLVDSLNANIKSRIRMLGSLSKKDLRRALSASDLFASFSLFHDEDFGMSPAEALISGLPCVLTDWGGYSSFVPPEGEWDCELLPVYISDLGHRIDVTSFHTAISIHYLHRKDEDSRTKAGEKFYKQFSPKSASVLLRELIKIKPVVYGDQYWKLAQFTKLVQMHEEKGVNGFFLPSEDSYYSEVYSNYISGKGKSDE